MITKEEESNHPDQRLTLLKTIFQKTSNDVGEISIEQFQSLASDDRRFGVDSISDGASAVLCTKYYYNFVSEYNKLFDYAKLDNLKNSLYNLNIDACLYLAINCNIPGFFKVSDDVVDELLDLETNIDNDPITNKEINAFKLFMEINHPNVELSAPVDATIKSNPNYAISYILKGNGHPKSLIDHRKAIIEESLNRNNKAVLSYGMPEHFSIMTIIKNDNHHIIIFDAGVSSKKTSTNQDSKTIEPCVKYIVQDSEFDNLLDHVILFGALPRGCLLEIVKNLETKISDLLTEVAIENKYYAYEQMTGNCSVRSIHEFVHHSLVEEFGEEGHRLFHDLKGFVGNKAILEMTDINSFMNNDLHECFKLDDLAVSLEVFKEFCEDYPDFIKTAIYEPNISGHTPLIEAIKFCDDNIIKEICEQLTNIDMNPAKHNGYSPIFCAIEAAGINEAKNPLLFTLLDYASKEDLLKQSPLGETIEDVASYGLEGKNSLCYKKCKEKYENAHIAQNNSFELNSSDNISEPDDYLLKNIESELLANADHIADRINGYIVQNSSSESSIDNSQLGDLSNSTSSRNSKNKLDKNIE